MTTIPAADIAATEPVSFELSLPLHHAVRLMDEHETAHLLVADHGRPVAMLSTLGLVGMPAWARA